MTVVIPPRSISAIEKSTQARPASSSWAPAAHGQHLEEPRVPELGIAPVLDERPIEGRAGDVGVGRDEAGRDDAIDGVDRLVDRPVEARAHVEDGVALDDDHAVPEQAVAAAVEGHHVGRAYGDASRGRHVSTSWRLPFDPAGELRRIAPRQRRCRPRGSPRDVRGRRVRRQELRDVVFGIRIGHRGRVTLALEEHRSTSREAALAPMSEERDSPARPPPGVGR